MRGTEGVVIQRRFRVGLVVLVALIAFAIGVFMVGKRASLFTRKVDYQIRFASASGLTAGNSVRLAGVTVGTVTEVALSEKPGDTTVTVLVAIERKMTSRIRGDTRASIKTIGLLGDKYIELEGGSEGSPEIPPGGQIAAASEAGIEKRLAGGEGLLGDLTEIARSLKIILGRTEAGKGLLGELTSESDRGKQIGSNLNQTLKQLSVMLEKVNSGKSLAGKLLVDEKYGRSNGQALSGAITSASNLFGKLSAAMNKRDGALPALIADPDGKKKVYSLIDNLSQAGVSLAKVSNDLDKGKGMLPVLLHDESFAKSFRLHLDNFAAHIDSVSEKLDSRDGTLGKFISDPSLYDAANDIVVGVNDSKLLKWLIRDRQKRGIRNRYEKERAKSPGEATENR
jgi:phospholipid/cholesterol/gamma-HCH transport system substrate-binding protein